MDLEDADTTPVDDRPVVGSLPVEIAALLLLFGLACLLGWDSWRIGAGWASDGPEAGYFPFYLSVLLGAASLYGIGSAIMERGLAADTFVNWDQFRRVLQVL